MQCLGCLPVVPSEMAAATLGVTAHVMRRLISEGVVVRMRRGVLVGACLLEHSRDDARLAHSLALQALQIAYPDAVASHESAVLRWGLPLLRMPAWPIVTRARGAWRGGDGGRVRVAPLPPHHVCAIAATGCTSLPRTVVDVARSLPFRDAVVVGDAALRRGCSVGELAAMLTDCAPWADLGGARRSIAFLDARAESPLESVSRAIFRERGLPAPELQYEITVDGEDFRVDFYWRRHRTIGEADGRSKYSLDPDRRPDEVAWLEKLREDKLRDAGYRFVRWTYGQMLGRTDETLARIERRLT